SSTPHSEARGAWPSLSERLHNKSSGLMMVEGIGGQPGTSSENAPNPDLARAPAGCAIPRSAPVTRRATMPANDRVSARFGWALRFAALVDREEAYADGEQDGGDPRGPNVEEKSELRARKRSDEKADDHGRERARLGAGVGVAIGEGDVEGLDGGAKIAG